MSNFTEDMKIKKSTMIQDCFDFKWKDLVFGSFGIFLKEKEVNIQFIQSVDTGKGNCQDFIKLFKEDVESRGYTLVSSYPISSTWEHIANKYELKIYKHEKERAIYQKVTE